MQMERSGVRRALSGVLGGASLRRWTKQWRWTWLCAALAAVGLFFLAATTTHDLRSDEFSQNPRDDEHVPRRGHSRRQAMLEQVYHSADLFRRDFRAMLETFRVFVYPAGDDPDGDFQTGNSSGEGRFLENLRQSRFVTKDSAAADLFFLPISSLMTLQGLRSDEMADAVERSVEAVISEYPFWNRTLGADHFFVTCHDVGARAMAKVAHLVRNSIRVDCSPSYNGSFVPHKDVAMPHARQPYPLPPGGDDVPHRAVLGFWAGETNSKVRENLVDAWQHDPVLFITKNRISRAVGEYVYQKQFYRSKFCVCPAGKQVNSARIAESIHYGCVPVVMADFVELPFHDILDWRKFALVLRESDYGNLKKVLQEVTMKEYRVLHAGVRQVRKHFQWHSPPVKYDAFHMVMYELWLRRFAIRY